ncbi:aminoglycoside phosphotransferase family protein [Tumebacillus flagellatus]|uniref:Aminoglycoside phosphotransferase domain-containing protein n=1 Tax=Tumebacillus flagellatus TaxID=1157490 RepID=A0A074LLA2_9BACL|nr:aminoglycoside phosphotransferase family protein [Tumebacillus flagellatus]KEO81894.1 hypothetical protein EL26_18845 [Tumebacillus flagellatus]
MGWELLQSTPLSGGYAASLFALTLRDEHGKRIEAVYKRFDPARIAELELYRTLLPEVPHAVPAVYGVIDCAGEQGLILEHAGVPVKSVFAKRDRAGQREMLRSLVDLLASLHLALLEKSEQWLAEGRVSTYPFESSAEWAETAVQELAWLAEQGMPGVHEETVREVQNMTAAFYPRYPEWAVGRLTYTHGDPHLENILWQNGQFRLIDWEWACVSLPQRDLAILLQDVLDDELHEEALEVFQRLLNPDDPVQFRRAFCACLFDNTLMMLGWEIGKFRNGFLQADELNEILAAKLRWLRTTFHNCLNA